MDISVFGLGYVGIVTAVCLCRDGHRVVGVDVSELKVSQLSRCESPIIEEGIADLIHEAKETGRFQVTTSAAEAVAASEIAIVCVGTPSARNGSLSTGYVEAVITEIGSLLYGRSSPFLVVMRSTMLPGTMRNLVIPLLSKQSQSKPGAAFEAVFHPEFLREGSSIKDFYDPPKIVVGERVPGAADRLLDLYEKFTAPIFRVGYETAEMVKFSDNIFHALKITFANEIGQFCRSFDINAHEIMDIFCADTKLNLSSKYLRPGFAFGGSCLPKDLRAFLYAARGRDIEVPLLDSVLRSNKTLIESTMLSILETGARSVGLFGLAFKPGTDDLRESPLVTLAELLNGKGVALKIYDTFVESARLIGKNKAYVEQHLPHLARMLVVSADELGVCDLILVGHPVKSDQLRRWLQSGKQVFDLLCFNQRKVLSNSTSFSSNSADSRFGLSNFARFAHDR